MAFAELHGQDASDSSALSITAESRVSDPFTAANLALTEVVASTSEDWAGFYILANLPSSTGARGIASVFAGGIGSETRVATVPTKIHYAKTPFFSMYVPVPVPSGTRLSIGFSGNTSFTQEFQIVGVPSSNFSAEPSFAVMDCGPFDLQNVFGDYGSLPTVDPGAAANTKGAFSELSDMDTNGTNNVLNGDSLGFQYKYLGFIFGDANNSAQTTHNRLFDLAYGAAASEIVFVNDFNVAVSNLEVGSPFNVFWIPWDRPAGDRISARMQASISDAVDRIGDIVMFGLR